MVDWHPNLESPMTKMILVHEQQQHESFYVLARVFAFYSAWAGDLLLYFFDYSLLQFPLQLS